MSKTPVKPKRKEDGSRSTEVETTGHEWDGIEEYNNPLPRWWLWTFYATTVWGILYTVAYPAWPLIHEATPGLLGFSTREDVQVDIAGWMENNAALEAELASVDLVALGDDEELYHYAIQSGASVFRNNCSQCHGSGAAGAAAGGYPNLLDDDWLWGGTLEEIVWTVEHGIRNEQSPDARWSEMPAFGDILEGGQIDALVNHVLAISGQDHDGALGAEGQRLFSENCAACHGEDGTGDPALGAPNLTDAIWLYGGGRASVEETIANSRFGVMPAWGPRLTDAQVNAVATYVHQLGGGE